MRMIMEIALLPFASYFYYYSHYSCYTKHNLIHITLSLDIPPPKPHKYDKPTELTNQQFLKTFTPLCQCTLLCHYNRRSHYAILHITYINHIWIALLNEIIIQFRQLRLFSGKINPRIFLLFPHPHV